MSMVFNALHMVNENNNIERLPFPQQQIMDTNGRRGIK